MEKPELTQITAHIVSAHVANNVVAVGDLPNLIEKVHEALARVAGSAEAEQKRREPLVSVRASVKPDYLVCMECGRKQKALKRHLQTAHGMTPEQYRKDYRLPDTYPMTAPNFSEQRRQVAKRMGLGGKSGPTRSAIRRLSKHEADQMELRE